MRLDRDIHIFFLIDWPAYETRHFSVRKLEAEEGEVRPSETRSGEKPHTSFLFYPPIKQCIEGSARYNVRKLQGEAQVGRGIFLVIFVHLIFIFAFETLFPLYIFSSVLFHSSSFGSMLGSN